MTFIDMEREITYTILECEDYFIVGFSLPTNPGKFFPASGFPHRREREAAELDLETLADAKRLRKVLDV